jgi:serine/threonine protein kinase
MQPLNLPYETIAGYHLTQKLGSGGMGDVYKAYHRDLQRTAAIKILHQPDMADRFRNEAYIQSSVKHRNIARLYEFTTAGSKPCIIMEYVDGAPLDQHLSRKSKLSDEEATAILIQISAALQYLHSQHIHHRDIKPQNFKIQADGTVKMLDFGIAKHRYTPKFTREGFIIGTTEYMAPEQFEQRSEMKSDIWSFGVMAYEMATGFMPFEAASPSAQRARLARGVYTNPRILVPGLSAKMLSVIERCLKVNPAHRASAKEIHLLLNGHTPNHIFQQQADKLTRYRMPLSYSLAAIVLLIAVGILFRPASSSSGALESHGGDDIIRIERTNGHEDSRKDADSKQQQGKANAAVIQKPRTIKINVPGIPRATLVFPDGSTRPAPYEITGEDGQQVKFLIQAMGYRDKAVDLQLKMGPRTYDFILEKIN